MSSWISCILACHLKWTLRDLVLFDGDLRHDYMGKNRFANMSYGTLPNLFIYYSIIYVYPVQFGFFSCVLSFVLMSFFSSLFMLILVYFFVAMFVLCHFYRLFNALGCTIKHTHKKKGNSGKDENRPLGSAISFSNHYTIGILKKCCRPENWVSRTWKQKALRTVEACTQQVTTDNRPSSTKTNWQLKHIIIRAVTAP